MKINGKVISGPYIDCIVFPRGTYDIVIKARAVLDDDDFAKICPRPNPPYVSRPGEEPSQDVEDETYKNALNDWAVRKTAWINIKALEATDGLEWDTVKLDNPNTWKNWTDDFRTSGFTDMEIYRIINLIQGVNGLDESKLETAKKRFLAGQVVISPAK